MHIHNDDENWKDGAAPRKDSEKRAIILVRETWEQASGSRRFCILLPSREKRAEGKRSDLDVGSLWTLQASLLELGVIMVIAQGCPRRL